MSCFGKIFFRGMKGGKLKKRYIFGVPLFWGKAVDFTRDVI